MFLLITSEELVTSANDSLSSPLEANKLAIEVFI